MTAASLIITLLYGLFRGVYYHKRRRFLPDVQYRAYGVAILRLQVCVCVRVFV